MAIERENNPYAPPSADADIHLADGDRLASRRDEVPLDRLDAQHARHRRDHPPRRHDKIAGTKVVKTLPR